MSRPRIICDTWSVGAERRLITIALTNPRMLVTTTAVHELRRISPTVDIMLSQSNPRVRDITEWHLPYIDSEIVEDIVIHLLQQQDGGLPLDELDAAAQRVACQVSAARCKRMSWKSESVADDLALFREILAAGEDEHLKHQALPDHRTPDGKWANEHQHAGLYGFRQYCAMLASERRLEKAA